MLPETYQPGALRKFKGCMASCQEATLVGRASLPAGPAWTRDSQPGSQLGVATRSARAGLRQAGRQTDGLVGRLAGLWV